MTIDQPTGMAGSTADVKVAIRETRQRLAEHVALTADHVHLIFTTPGYIANEVPVGGAVAAAINTIAVAGQARRVWINTKRTDRLRRARIAGMIVVIGAALVTWRQRR